MNNVKKVAAGMFTALALGTMPTVQADVVFGITGSGDLIESDSWENLMNASYHINHGKSPVGWNWGHRYFMADGYMFGVDGRNHLVQYDSVEDLWNGVNFVDYGKSPQGWTRVNQFFAHDGEYFGMSGNGTLVRSSSVLDLWNGVYVDNYGRTPNGWDSNNTFLLTTEGLYGLSDNSRQFYWSEGSQLQYGGASATILAPQSPFGWSYNNQFFGDNSMNGIALNAQGNLIDASAPLAIGAFGLLGLLAVRRKKA